MPLGTVVATYIIYENAPKMSGRTAVAMRQGYKLFQQELVAPTLRRKFKVSVSWKFPKSRGLILTLPVN